MTINKDRIAYLKSLFPVNCLPHPPDGRRYPCQFGMQCYGCPFRELKPQII